MLVHLNHHIALAQANAQHYLHWLCSIYWWANFFPFGEGPVLCTTHIIWALKGITNSHQVFVFSPSPRKNKHAAVFACIFITQTYSNMYLSEKTIKQQTSHLNLEGGWEEYCARHSLSRSSPHNIVPKEQKLCWWRLSSSMSASRFSIRHLVCRACGTELPVNYINTVVLFWRNKASMAELKEILLHFSLHSVNRVPGLAPSTNKGLWVFELELNTKNTTIRFSKPREL